MASYSGAWKRSTLPISKVPLKPGLDPEHAAPVDEPEPTWQDQTGAPQLPTEWSGVTYEQLPAPSAYVDRTPVSHEVGVGMLPGVDQETAQFVGGRARSVDLGAADARDFERPSYQEDGSTHTDVVSRPLDGTSPQTLLYQEKGVGVSIDPDARSNRSIRRRPTGPAQYDSRWYADQMRPRYQKQAKGSAPASAPVAGRSVFNSPEAKNVIMRPDNWADPIIRRSPSDWDQPAETDQQVGGADFGLGRYGL